MDKWSTEFDEKPMKSELDEDFVGVTRSVPRSGTIEYTCGGVIKSMAELITPYPLGPSITVAYPMSAGAPRELRDALAKRTHWYRRFFLSRGRSAAPLDLS